MMAGQTKPPTGALGTRRRLIGAAPLLAVAPAALAACGGTARDAAWNFMHWVAGPKGQRVEVEYTWTAPHYFSLDSKFGLRMGSAGATKNLAVAQDFMPYASPERPELNPRYSESLKVLAPALTRVADGEMTAKQGMESIKPQMDALLKQGVAEDQQ